MKATINKNEIKLTHALLSAAADDPDLLQSIIENCSLCFDMSKEETEHTLKTLDKKIAQQLKQSLIMRAA